MNAAGKAIRTWRYDSAVREPKALVVKAAGCRKTEVCVDCGAEKLATATRTILSAEGRLRYCWPCYAKRA